MGRLHGVKICRNGPIISHLLFANDSLFLIRVTKQNCRVLKNILDTYCVALGQMLNYDKFSIFLSTNTSPATGSDICKTLGISCYSWS